MDKMHFSTAQCFEQCPARYDFRYRQGLEVIESDDPSNALKLGTCLHRGQEVDLQTAIQEYLMSYPIVTDEHINEVIKLEHWIPRVKELLPEGLHEVNMQNDWYEGTMDLLVPCTKHDAELPHGQFDLYDFKYSNNKEHYMESNQLHVYKYFCEQTTGKRIRKMFFVFVPKVSIKRGKTETLEDFRRRIHEELNEEDVEIREVIYDPAKVLQFFETTVTIQYAKEFPKKPSFLCNWCEYQDYCMKGDNTMLLPSTERRQVGQTTKRKLWIYGSAFSGKTTFVDDAPNPLNLNTDGNIQFVTMPFIPIKDTYEGRIKVFAWKNFKDAITELERGGNDFKTIVVDLLEDTYEQCRLYMYDQMGITHESDDSFKAWDKVRTEFLSTIRRLMNLDYENIILISHEDTSRDITKKSSDKITAIKPNLQDKVANKVAGMVDIVARVVVEDDDTRILSFKSTEMVFGGGRLKNISKTQIPLDWNALMEVYEEANAGKKVLKAEEPVQKASDEVKEEDSAPEAEEPSERPRRRSRRASSEPEPMKDGDMNPPEESVADVDTGTGTITGATPEEVQEAEEGEKTEAPTRTRRSRRTRE